MDRKIDFLIIGAQKAGSTALYHFLGKHPDVFLPAVKELRFFSHDPFFRLGERYLEAFYPSTPAARVLGAADVGLLYLTSCAERIRAYNPEMRILAVLHNPVDRAYSAYWFMRATGWETCRSFEEALEREPWRQGGGELDRAKLTYLEHGHYAEQLQVYLKVFGRGRVRTLLAEELGEPDERGLAATFAWLGVDPCRVAVDVTERVNAAVLPRSVVLERVLRSSDVWLKRFYRAITSARVRYFVMHRIRMPLWALNRRTQRYPPMDPTTRRRLVDYFAPHNEALGRLLRRDMSRWNQ
jgi:Sulfotransferase domain